LNRIHQVDRSWLYHDVRLRHVMLELRKGLESLYPCGSIMRIISTLHQQTESSFGSLMTHKMCLPAYAVWLSTPHSRAFETPGPHFLMCPKCPSQHKLSHYLATAPSSLPVSPAPSPLTASRGQFLWDGAPFPAPSPRLALRIGPGSLDAVVDTRKPSVYRLTLGRPRI
jgi:hypothetical protein